MVMITKNPMTKHCNKCNKVKSIDEFYYLKNLNRYKNQCRECQNKVIYDWRKLNPDKVKNTRSKYCSKQENKLKINESNRQWIKNNPSKIKASRARYRNKPENKIKLKEYLKKWRKENPQSASLWAKNNPTRRKELDIKSHFRRGLIPKNRISQTMSNGIRISLNGGKNKNHWESLVNYTLNGLMEHLERLFKDSMSWDNQGKWHIDHIIPISLWQFKKPEDREFKQCWALCNLQPLWAKENQRKGNKCLI